jgi:hypothetical protein
MELIKTIKEVIQEYLNEQQILKENNNLDDIDISKLLNKFISDPVELMRILNVSTVDLLSPEQSMKLTLFAAKFKDGLYNNWAEIHKNLTATIDGMDVSKHLKQLIYPTDVTYLIKDTDNFLKRLENRVKQRKNTAMKQDDYSNPYGRAWDEITPLSVVEDSLNNPNTKYNYTQYEYAQADLDLQLIKLIKSGNLEVKTSDMKSSESFINEIIDVLKNGLKGEELLNLIHISDLRRFVEKFWRKNKKAIEIKYIDAKNKGTNQILVNTIEGLKK